MQLFGRTSEYRGPRRRRTDGVPVRTTPRIGARIPRRRRTDPAPATARIIARELAISVGQSVADTETLAKLRAIARLWRSREKGIPDELVYIDAYAVEFALDRVSMSEPLRVTLREEFREKLADLGVDSDAYLQRHRVYTASLDDNRRLAQRGVVRGIAETVGETFTAGIGTDNALLAEAVGVRFIDRTEALRRYLETEVRDIVAK